MNDTYTTREIAAAQGITLLAVNKRSTSEAWPVAGTRQARGGGKVFALGGLPEDVRLALARAFGQTAVCAGQAQAARVAVAEAAATAERLAVGLAGLAELARLRPQAQRRAEARAALVQAWRGFAALAGLPPTPARAAFCRDYNAGRVAVDPWVREAVPSASPASLGNWARAIAREGSSRLAGKFGNRRGSGRIDTAPDIAAFVLGMLHDHPHCSANHVMKGLRAKFEAGRLPSMRGLQRWMANFKERNKSLLLAVANPDKWRSTYRTATGSRSSHIERLNQRWEMDSTKGDLMLADGHRHVIVGVVDVYTRRLKFHVSRTSSSRAVLALLRRALLDWGAPEQVCTDNGQDYVSRHVQRVLSREEGLGIEHDIAPLFEPDYKAFIERGFQTLLHDLVELMPGFVGHNVAQRKDIEARKSFAQRLMHGHHKPIVAKNLTAEQLQAFCDRWVEDIYTHNPHTGEGMDGLTPFQKTVAWTEAPRRIENERALDVLLLPAAGDDGRRMVGKRGVKVERDWFDAPELGPHRGQWVRVLCDDDLGEVMVFGEDPEDARKMVFVCRALNLRRLGLSRKELAVAVRVAQQRAIAEGKAMLKQMAKEAGAGDVVTKIFKHRAAQSGKFVEFPRQGEAYDSPGLQQAARAADSRKAPVRRELTAEEQAVRAELAARPATVHNLPETPRQRWTRWNEIAARLAAGERISAEEEAFWSRYQTTDEYWGWAVMAKQAGQTGQIGKNGAKAAV